MTVIRFALPLFAAMSMPVLAEPVLLDSGHLFMLDEDGDGTVSKSEYDAFADFAFETIDRNGDNALSPDEVDDHLTGDAFGILDDDGNGTVSPAEFSAQMNEDFDAADKDDNETLN